MSVVSKEAIKKLADLSYLPLVSISHRLAPVSNVNLSINHKQANGNSRRECLSPPEFL